MFVVYLNLSGVVCRDYVVTFVYCLEANHIVCFVQLFEANQRV